MPPCPSVCMTHETEKPKLYLYVLVPKDEADNFYNYERAVVVAYNAEHARSVRPAEKGMKRWPDSPEMVDATLLGCALPGHKAGDVFDAPLVNFV